jgi:flagellar motor protein MotB
VPDVVAYAAISTLCLAVIGYSIKLTWQASRIEKEQQLYTDAQTDNLRRDLTKAERSGIAQLDTLRREAGEMGAALRTKMHEMETWNRDTFVRKESFELVIGRIEKSFEKMTDKLEEKFEKMVERIERSGKP